MTPHIGGMSDRYAEQVLPLMIHNLRAFSNGRMGDMENMECEFQNGCNDRLWNGGPLEIRLPVFPSYAQ